MKAWSVVVPALNEAAELRGCLESARAASRPDEIETLVVDGGSSDGTPELARELADRVLASERGRGRQMNAGARAASGRGLVFLHADARLPRGWDEALERAWAEPGVALTAFSIRYDEPGWAYRLIETTMHARARLLGMAYGDHALATRRALFEKIGGFPDIPLMEDAALAGRLRGEGRLRLLPESVLLSARRQKERGPLLNAARNGWLFLRWRLGASPEALYREYYRR